MTWWVQGDIIKVWFDCLRLNPVFIIFKKLRLGRIRPRYVYWNLFGGLSLHRKNLSESMSGKGVGIPIYFPWIRKKYSHTLGNLWKLVSHIWKLCGFFNSISFYSNSTVWEYISFPHNIPIVWHFTLPILCELLGFRNNF